MLERVDPAVLSELEDAAKLGEIGDPRFRQITGYTMNAFLDKYGTML